MIARLLAGSALLALLAGCDIPPELAARAEPPSAEGKPYPNLGSVPRNPSRLPTGDTQTQMRTLEAERAAGQQAEAALRVAGIPDAPPEPVRLAPVGPGRGQARAPAVAAAVAAPAAAAILAFPAGTTRLLEDHREQIRAAAAQFAPNSRVRVVAGWLSSADRPAARARARATAGEIIRMGVAASRVDIRDQQGTAGPGPGKVEILVDY